MTEEDIKLQERLDREAEEEVRKPFPSPDDIEVTSMEVECNDRDRKHTIKIETSKSSARCPRLTFQDHDAGELEAELTMHRLDGATCGCVGALFKWCESSVFEIVTNDGVRFVTEYEVVPETR